MRITSKGQVTIPEAIRSKAGLLPGTEVDFSIDTDGRVRLERVNDNKRREELRKYLANLEVNLDLGGMTTDEYMEFLRGETWEAEQKEIERSGGGERG